MSITMKSLCLAAGFGFLAITTACSSAIEPSQSALGPKLPDPGADKEYEVNFPDPGHGVTRYIGIEIDRDLSATCGLMRTYFAFDSDKLSVQDKATLRRVAECLDQPKLEHLKLSIVGRADARGGNNYNADLGRRRAESVMKLLVDAGITESRMSIASRGANGAVGGDAPTEPYSRGYDRRVDVVLLGVVQAPN
ncbi:MAG TPA: OmpA family protein [Polyangium sp.]|nr:OmpA family protein [Polyangium sp.]